LVRAVKRLGTDEDDESPEVAAFTAMQREFVKELDAFVRKEVKHGGTRKPKGDELTLLLVKGIDRVGTALEGLLDLARHMVSLLYRRFDVVLMSCSKVSLRSALMMRRLIQAPTALVRLLAAAPSLPRRARASVPPMRLLPVRRPRNLVPLLSRDRCVRVALLPARARRSRARTTPSWCRLIPTRMIVRMRNNVFERCRNFALS
jgi:hypothetical protein